MATFCDLCGFARDTFLILVFFCFPPFANAQLEILPNTPPPFVFSETPQTIEIRLHNTSQEAVSSELQTRLFQASSSTLMPVGELQPWKKLQLLPNQTIVESITLTFPSIKAPCRFQVVFNSNSKKVGSSEVWVYPADSLKQLKALGGEKSIGLIDPNNYLKPIFKKHELPFEEFSTDSLPSKFDGKFIIAGPFQTKEQKPSSLDEWISKQTIQGIPVISIQSFDKAQALPTPSLCLITRGTANHVQLKLSSLPTNESASFQLQLIQLAELAVNPREP